MSTHPPSHPWAYTIHSHTYTAFTAIPNPLQKKITIIDHYNSKLPIYDWQVSLIGRNNLSLSKLTSSKLTIHHCSHTPLYFDEGERLKEREKPILLVIVDQGNNERGSCQSVLNTSL